MSTSPSRADALRHLTEKLRAAGVETPALDARVLLMHVADLSATDIYAWPDNPLLQEAAQKLSALGERRAAREPLARILGEREFWGLPFTLAPATLVPRPDTEILVETALTETARMDAECPRALLRFADLGTGSGCIAVAFMHELYKIGRGNDAYGIAVDLSPEAASTARGNAKRNSVDDRLGFITGSWSEALADKSLDLILSNPPYIESIAITALDAEVRDHDPRLALDGGTDGLAPYRAIFADARRLLRPGGAVIVEYGIDLSGISQAEAIAHIALANGLSPGRPVSDLGGIQRVIVATLS